METIATTTPQNKTSLDSLSKEEIITKYKSLLNLAKKAKLAKDELTEENKKLKDSLHAYEQAQVADKKSLEAMQEIITNFTENKLQLTNQIAELKKQRKIDMEALEKLSIENESIKRQLKRFSEDNETLLSNLEQMEKQLQQVNELGQEQKYDLVLLEEQVTKLKNVERINEQLQNDNRDVTKALEKLQEKYKYVKEINLEQKVKFNSLKERFIDVHRKLKKLKECKKILLETQHEYAESISQWQQQIIKASKLLCREFNNLKIENAQLLTTAQQTATVSAAADQHHRHHCDDFQYYDYGFIMKKINNLINLSEKAFNEQLNMQMHEQKDMSKVCIIKLNDIIQLSYKALEEQNQLKNENDELKNFHHHNSSNHTKMLHKIHNIIQLYDKVVQQEKSEEKDAFNKNRISEISQMEQSQSGEQLILQNNSKQNEEQGHEQQQQHSLILFSSKQNEFEYNDENRISNEQIHNFNETLQCKGEVLQQQQKQHQWQQKYEELLKSQQEIMTKELSIKDNALHEKDKQITSLHLEMEQIYKKLTHYEQIHPNEIAQVHSDNAESKTVRKLNDLGCKEIVNDKDNDNDNDDDASDNVTCDNLRVQLKHLTNVKLELEEQLKTKQMELDNLDRQYKEQQKSLTVLKSENQKLHASRKQTNVLNLEIEAAEKSLKDVADKLNARNNELTELKDVLTTREANNKQLRQEIELLELAKEAELKHSRELKAQIDQLQQTLKDVVHGKQLAHDNCKALQMEIDQLKSELEHKQLQLAKTSGEYENMMTHLKTENHNIKQKLNHTQEKLQTVEHRLKNAERNTDDLRNEFLDYKVKAQTVLKNQQHQTRDLSKESELEEELFLVKRSEEQYKRIIETLNKKCETMEQQMKLLQNENANLHEHNKQLIFNNDELRQHNDNLAQEIKQHIQQQHETLKQHRLQLNTLDEYHKEQLETLQETHEKQLEQLLRTSKDNQLMNDQVINDKEIRKRDKKKDDSSLVMFGNNEMRHHHSTQNKIDLLLMEREDAEGSEEEKGDKQRSTKHASHEFMPLDELLNTPINAIHTETLITTTVSANGNNNTNNNGTTSDISNINMLRMELNTTRERLQKQESRVRHLTTLLAENEQDLAKLTQLNDMLKEELRRQERSVEREQHMHNSEYLKNVLIKFLTLNQGDEKLRLVPVLNTILKLSRNETEILNCVAKGQKVNTDTNQRTNSAATNIGWGNFLTSWTNNNHI